MKRARHPGELGRAGVAGDDVTRAERAQMRRRVPVDDEFRSGARERPILQGQPAWAEAKPGTCERVVPAAAGARARRHGQLLESVPVDERDDPAGRRIRSERRRQRLTRDRHLGEPEPGGQPSQDKRPVADDPPRAGERKPQESGILTAA